MEKVEFIYATFIRTTPEKLWEALTNGVVNRALLIRLLRGT